MLQKYSADVTNRNEISEKAEKISGRSGLGDY
jgi:hypothetical protein